jgi:hypothetical protein
MLLNTLVIQTFPSTEIKENSQSKRMGLEKNKIQTTQLC